MRTSKTLFITLLLSVVTFCAVFAQQPSFNYVLTTKGDTIKCDFKRPFLGKIRYIPVGSDKAIKVTTDDIKEYYTAKDSTLVIAAVLPDETSPEFLNLLERGKINMYEKIVVTYNK